jgi:hypothetical protein
MESLSQDPVADVTGALATQTASALLTRLAQAARNAILEERNRLAGEIRDSFTLRCDFQANPIPKEALPAGLTPPHGRRQRRNRIGIFSPRSIGFG